MFLNASVEVGTPAHRDDEDAVLGEVARWPAPLSAWRVALRLVALELEARVDLRALRGRLASTSSSDALVLAASTVALASAFAHLRLSLFARALAAAAAASSSPSEAESSSSSRVPVAAEEEASPPDVLGRF